MSTSPRYSHDRACYTRMVRAYVLDERGVKVSDDYLLRVLTQSMTDAEFTDYINKHATRDGINPATVAAMVEEMLSC